MSLQSQLLSPSPRVVVTLVAVILCRRRSNSRNRNPASITSNRPALFTASRPTSITSSRSGEIVITVTVVTESVIAVTVVVTFTSCCCHFDRSTSGPSGHCGIVPVRPCSSVHPTGCFARCFAVFCGVRDCFRGESDVWRHFRRGSCHQTRTCC